MREEHALTCTSVREGHALTYSSMREEQGHAKLFFLSPWEGWIPWMEEELIWRRNENRTTGSSHAL